MAHTKNQLPVPIPAAALRRWCVEASVDPRTLRKVAAGIPVRGMAADRARAVLDAVGYPVPAARRGK